MGASICRGNSRFWCSALLEEIRKAIASAATLDRAVGTHTRTQPTVASGHRNSFGTGKRFTMGQTSMGTDLTRTADRMLALSAVAFVLLVGVYFATQRPRASSNKVFPNNVVIATENLEVGHLIQESDLKVASQPYPLPPGVITEKRDAVGRGVVSPIQANEPILESRLAPRGAGGGFAAVIPRGLRTIAVPIHQGGALPAPGTHVDVLASNDSPSRSNGEPPVLKTVGVDLEVLSAAQLPGDDSEPFVTNLYLLATPVQARLLNTLVGKMQLYFAVRSADAVREQPAQASAVEAGSDSRRPQGTR